MRYGLLESAWSPPGRTWLLLSLAACMAAYVAVVTILDQFVSATTRPVGMTTFASC